MSPVQPPRPSVSLSNGVEMPLLGLGVWRIRDGEQTENAVGWALEAGYRHIDTAQLYGNELAVGRAVHLSGVDRSPPPRSTLSSGDDATKEAIVGPMMGDEWPVARVFPNQLVNDGDAVMLGGVAFRVRSLGSGESFEDTMWEMEPATLFAGDVAYNGVHAYLADGQWESWLSVLDRLERDLPDDVALHVGHGPAGGKELLARQRRYIETFVSSVQHHADAVAAGDHDPVLADMRRLLPSEDLLFLLDLSIAPMFDMVARDRS
jgi:glyoxylase-like metal-dependent hydrolase (beta-lactamase superfamily II)